MWNKWEDKLRNIRNACIGICAFAVVVMIVVAVLKFGLETGTQVRELVDSESKQATKEWAEPQKKYQDVLEACREIKPVGKIEWQSNRIFISPNNGLTKATHWTQSDIKRVRPLVQKMVGDGFVLDQESLTYDDSKNIKHVTYRTKRKENQKKSGENKIIVVESSFSIFSGSEYIGTNWTVEWENFPTNEDIERAKPLVEAFARDELAPAVGNLTFYARIEEAGLSPKENYRARQYVIVFKPEEEMKPVEASKPK